jgi:hypothetical protein
MHFVWERRRTYVKNWCRCAGKIPFNHQIVRKVASVCNQLPTIETQAFKDDFTSEYSDALLVAYLASITKYVVVGGIPHFPILFPVCMF